MGVMEALKKGLAAPVKNLGLVLILFAFNLIFNLASIPLAITPGTVPTPQLSATALLFSAVFILISIFVQGGSLGLIKDYVKEGKMKLAAFASYGLKYYLRLLGLGLLIVLIISIVALIAALIIMVTAPLNNVVVTVIAAVIAIVIGALGLYYLLLLLMSPYSLVCDEAGVIESMKKSIRTVRKNAGKVLLLFVLLVLISLGIGFLVGFLVGLLSAIVPTKASQVLIGIVSSAINGYLGVVMTASFMVLYLALASREKSTESKVF